MTTNHKLVVCYPNKSGDHGRYELHDQRAYFSRFELGSSFFFQIALEAVLSGNLVEYDRHCEMVFDNEYENRFNDNTASMSDYHNDRREFFRRTFDIYRYAKSSLATIGGGLGYQYVRRISNNPKFDTGMFLLS